MLHFTKLSRVSSKKNEKFIVDIWSCLFFWPRYILRFYYQWRGCLTLHQGELPHFDMYNNIYMMIFTSDIYNILQWEKLHLFYIHLGLFFNYISCNTTMNDLWNNSENLSSESEHLNFKQGIFCIVVLVLKYKVPFYNLIWGWLFTLRCDRLGNYFQIKNEGNILFWPVKNPAAWFMIC